MLFDTLGFNYFVGYIFPASVTDGIHELKREDSRNYYKIIYIKTGPSHFLLNGKEFILTGACAICMNEKDKISFLDVCEEAVKVLWLKPSVINSQFNYDMLNNPSLVLSSSEYQDMYYLNQFLHNASTTTKILSLHTMDSTMVETKVNLIKELLSLQSSNTWPCRTRSYIFEILFCLSRQEEDEREIKNIFEYEGRSRLAIEVIYYLQSCYSQKITIEKLTDEFHTNRTSLLSDFKKYTGLSINNYLVQLRLMMASTLLRDTELAVDEICDRTGFNDISYFSKVFKKKLSYTPSEYRRISHSTSVSY